MDLITVHDKQFKPYISADKISEEVSRVASEINKDYSGRRPLFIAILNGSFMFAADLFKQVNIEAEICFIKLASYKGIKSSGQVITAIGLDVDLVGREIIVVEDIVDTGNTLSKFLPQIYHHNPASLKIAALLHKPEAMVHPIKIDYLVFSVPNKFLLGFVFDFDGLVMNR